MLLRVFGIAACTAATKGQGIRSASEAGVKKIFFIAVVISSAVTSRKVSLMFFSCFLK